MITATHMIIDHINAVGPQSASELLHWIREQISGRPTDVLAAALIDGRVYRYREDGIDIYTTKDQDPR